MHSSFSSDDHIAVAMSGGVDSSVSAALLKQTKASVSGIFMHNWQEQENQDQCSAKTDLEQAQKVAKKLDIPLHVIDFSYEYWEKVFSPYLDLLSKGYTPNPDVYCNRFVKFDCCLEYALQLGANYLATGHYARTKWCDANDSNARIGLYQAADLSRDQSYFLYDVALPCLEHCVFPLSDYQKTQVRAIARDHQFENHNRKESRGICFIGKRRFAAFIGNFLKPQPGLIVGLDGHTLGEHTGLFQFSIGQRQGLGLGGGNGEPWFVCAKNAASNTLIVVQGHEHDALYSHHAVISEPTWLDFNALESQTLWARSRHLQAPQSCTVIAEPQGELHVHFKAPQHGLTPGQALVVYSMDRCVAGGMITQSHSRVGPVLTRS